MNLKILFLSFILFNPVNVYANSHCQEYTDTGDCKEEVKDLLDLFYGKSGDSSKYPDGTLEERNYNFFKDEGSHFKELVAEGKFISASMLFEKYEDSYFYKKAFIGGEVPVDKLDKEVTQVVNALQDKLIPGISEKTSIINKNLSLVKNSNKSLSPKWKYFSKLINDSNQLYKDYKSYRIIALSGKSVQRNKKSLELYSAIKAFKQELKRGASKELDRYDFSSGKDFFGEYPVKLNKSRVVSSSSKTVLGWLKESTLDESINLINKYNLNNSSTVKNKLAGILLDKASRATYGNKQPSFMDVMATVKQIQGLGINIETSVIPMRYKTTFFQVEKMADFNNIKVVLKEEEPYLAVIDKRRVDINKGKGKLDKIYSEYVSSRSMVSNPDYVSARSTYNNVLQGYNAAVQKHRYALERQEQSRREYQREQEMRRLSAGYDTNCTGYGSSINCTTSPGLVMFVPDYSSTLGGIGPAIAQGKVTEYRGRLSNAERRLNNIPREVEKLNYTEYSFSTKTYNLVKTYEYVLHLVNRVTNEYSVINVPLSKEKKFVVANNIHPQDSNHKLTNFETLDDMKMFISGQDDFSVGEIMNEIPAEHSLVRYSSLKKLLSSIKSSYKGPDFQATSKLLVVDDSKNIRKNETSSDYIQDLERIKALLDNGVISEDDYKTLKQKIINKL